jgi:anti-sigma regulatory factor (Ser/Thr protein kinase)
MTDAFAPPARAVRAFRNDAAELRPMSEWFRALARATGFPPERALDFELCLNELMANTIQHGRGAAEQQIRIELELDARSIRATVEDEGRPFDPAAAEARPERESLEMIRTGGWGIPIVRAFANEFRYERRDGRNRVTITMRA